MRICNWIEALSYCQQKRQPFVVATVIEHKGSVPRDSGSKMVITSEETFDSIGGGNLEFQVTRRAREMLIERAKTILMEEYPLSARVGQCCGGFAKVLLELHQTTQVDIAVFGAGHVANELLPILQRLPLHIHWIDERENLFPGGLQPNVTTIHTDCAVTELKQLPQNTLVLLMTHNHQLDFELVRTAIARRDIAYIGLIGSETKAKRFRYKLAQRDVAEQDIARMISPVGERSVPGKTPIEVAISISAQIVQQLHLITNQKGQTTSAPLQPSETMKACYPLQGGA